MILRILIPHKDLKPIINKYIHNKWQQTWNSQTQNWTGCNVPGDTLQHRLEEGISHRRTRQVTQLFIYLLTQRRTAWHAHIGLYAFVS